MDFDNELSGLDIYYICSLLLCIVNVESVEFCGKLIVCNDIIHLYSYIVKHRALELEGLVCVCLDKALGLQGYKAKIKLYADKPVSETETSNSFGNVRIVKSKPLDYPCLNLCV